jgi:hypothetical protein
MPRATCRSSLATDLPVAISLPRPRLTLYGRGYCHLCDDMIAALEAAVRSGEFDLDRVDVDAFPELEARFGERVPVLMHGEIEICHYFLNLDRLREVLGAIR